MTPKEIIICICALLFIIFVLSPIYFFVEGFIRPCAVIYVILKQTNCGKPRDLLTIILAILGLFFLFFIFGAWAIVQLILNLIPYCTRQKKFNFSGQEIIDFLWPKDHLLFKLVIDIFSKIRGQSISSQI